MKEVKSTILIIAAILVISGINSSFYIIDEGKQAIITQFGKPVDDAVTDAGMHYKLPFIQDVRYIDKRILSWDGYPNQIPTKDKKYIKVDTTARWKITDALKFIQTVQNERGAKARLDNLDKLLQALYRIDIDDKLSDQAFELGEINQVARRLAELIVERQLQKLQYSHQFKHNK